MPRRRSTTTATTSTSIASNRKFGVEIEFTGIGLTNAARALSNAGLSVDHGLTGRYTHHDSASHWKVVRDGSVCDGGEVVSPILSGTDGLEQVEKAARALSAAGATANRSCGLHVHVNARDLTVADMKNAVERYASFEGQIDAFMPRSRRGNNNAYCYSNAQYLCRISVNRRFNSATTIRRFSETFGTRFMKLNLESYTRHGSLEFRQHSGTVQASKIIPWIQFCVNFIEQSRTPRARVARSSVSNSTGGRGQLRAMQAIVASLEANGNLGSNATDLASSAGVTAATAVVYISKLRTIYGFGIKKVRSTGKYVMTRRGTLPVGNNATSSSTRRAGRTNTGSDDVFRGLPPEVVSYFQERAAELAA